MKRNNEPIEYYMGLRYPVTVYHAEEGGYVVEIEDLPGCITQGETLEEVAKRIEEARHGWIEAAYEDGMEIPLPRTSTEYSGRFVIRIPRYLHRRLARQAMREGVSLNQYVESLLSAGESAQDVNKEILEAIKQISKPLLVESRRSKYSSLPSSWNPAQIPDTEAIKSLKSEQSEGVAA